MDSYFSSLNLEKNMHYDDTEGIGSLASVFVPKIEMADNEQDSSCAPPSVAASDMNSTVSNEAFHTDPDNPDCEGDRKPKQVYTCHVCNKNFNWKGNLITHMRCHSGEEERPRYPCHICFKVFNWKSNLKTHLNRLHYAGDQPPAKYKCQHCAKEFTWKNSLTTHVQVMHAGHSPPPTLSCEVCNKQFRWKSNLNTHMEAHRRVAKLACPVCGRLFNWKSNLKAHMNSAHLYPPGAKHRCTVCDKLFNTKASLQKHVDTIHNESVCSNWREEFQRIEAHKTYLRNAMQQKILTKLIIISIEHER
ncbi:hypothetical protein LSTR_LSTR013145, partial [Laodelphax striatellus]